MREALKRIPVHQRSLVMPQVEQFNMEVVPMGFGLLGRARVPQASGWCWVGPIDDDRLISIVRLAFTDDFPFYEQPEVEYSCIALLSTASAQIMDAIWEHDRAGSRGSDVHVAPSLTPLLEAESEHASAFTMLPRLYESPLAAGTTHAGVCVHLLPSYFEKLERLYPGEVGWLKGAIDNRVDASASLELRSILRSITPRQANMPVARLHYEGKALDAVSALVRFLSDSDDATNEHVELSARVKELLAASLDKPPTLDELAAACYTSRTSLCNEFKHVCGMSVGAYLTKLRVTQAQVLLETTEEPVSSIARAVGYRHASTFAAMFKRSCGMSPQAWRNVNR